VSGWFGRLGLDATRRFVFSTGFSLWCGRFVKPQLFEPVDGHPGGSSGWVTTKAEAAFTLFAKKKNRFRRSFDH